MQPLFLSKENLNRSVIYKTNKKENFSEVTLFCRKGKKELFLVPFSFFLPCFGF